MSKYVKLLIAVVSIGLFASCASNFDCKCDVPGAALVEVFMADDGKPNVNIETLTVYPGQIIVFRGLDEFSLEFPIDPQDPSNRDVKIKSKDGKIKIKISKKFDEILSGKSSRQNDMLVRARSDYDSSDPVDYFIIKYNVESGGKVRDPRIKIIQE